MKVLKRLGFDIAYLALLTKEQVKPLSRWEGKFSRRQVKALQHLGLKTDTVDRKLLNGGTKPELIFSTSSRYLELYRKKYHHNFIAKDRQTVRTEGFLFGYPNCCVRNFAENGYTDNQFVGQGQEILFHWACPGCRATPELLPYYEVIHNDCQKLLADERSSAPRLLRASLPAAALSLLFALVPGRARADDPHWYCPSAIDPTGDFLNEHEELLLGTVWGGFPEDLPNGAREALVYDEIIKTLPDTCCSVQWFHADGTENCQVCGQPIDMGFILIHNHKRDLMIQLHFIALHYLEHGSFSYDGSVHSGRIDTELLKEILAYRDTDHYTIETANDADGDGLSDDQESHFGMQTGDPDSDDDQLVDGAQVAEHILEAIARLPIAGSPGSAPDDRPHLYFDIAYGLEHCDICGMTINMGDVVVANPLIDSSMRFPIVGLHYLAHGRFAYGGSANSGEIDALELANILDTSTQIPPAPVQPREFQLFLRNFPNPFNAGTQIAFHLPQAGQTSLRIHNINGQLVKTLREADLAAGDHRVHWDGMDDHGQRMASGVYFCRLEYGGMVKAVKMVLVK